MNNEKKEKPQQDSVERFHPLYLKKYIEKSALKLANDECYPESIMAGFRSFKVGSLEDVYDLVKNVINSFDGNAENFYPKFYKVISGATSPFGNNLGRNSSLLLGFELANHVLSHLSGTKLQQDVINFEDLSKDLTEKEKNIICYLSGYVFGTYYRRLRFSKSCTQSLYHQQCLTILIAGKSSAEMQDLTEHKLVNARNRGGLWKVSKEVISIFTTTETFFDLQLRRSTERSIAKKSCYS